MNAIEIKVLNYFFNICDAPVQKIMLTLNDAMDGTLVLGHDLYTVMSFLLSLVEQDPVDKVRFERMNSGNYMFLVTYEGFEDAYTEVVAHWKEGADIGQSMIEDIQRTLLNADLVVLPASEGRRRKGVKNG